MKLLGYNIHTDYPKLPIEKKVIINTINPHSYCVSKKDEDFRQALKKSDILLPDGVGIVWAARFLRNRKIGKIAGFDIFLYLMKEMNDSGRTCFFLGASEKTLQLIKERAKKDFPNVKVLSFSPPYKKEFSESDSNIMIEHINRCQPYTVFVGMTAPKQEKWVDQNREYLDANVICSIGAVFDFYAGTVKRPGAFWIKMGLEWLPRFLKEPRRLARRNLISTPTFIVEVLYFKLFGKAI